jgi:hypothetical protein
VDGDTTRTLDTQLPRDRRVKIGRPHVDKGILGTGPQREKKSPAKREVDGVVGGGCRLINGMRLGL